MSSIMFYVENVDTDNPVEKCTLYDGSGCNGQSITFSGSDANFVLTYPEWNDKVQSMRCFLEFPDGSLSAKSVAFAKRAPETVQIDVFEVSFCREKNYNGCVIQASNWEGVCYSEWNGHLVSIDMKGSAHTCYLYSGEGCRGKHITVTQSVADLATDRWSGHTKSARCVSAHVPWRRGVGRV